MSDIAKALDILYNSSEKQLLYVGEVVSLSDTETIVSINGVNVEAICFEPIVVGNKVALLYQNRKYYIIGKQGEERVTHKHVTSDIISGHFSIERGGTGATDKDTARTNLGAASINHTHSEYSPISHNHDSTYSKLTHNHDSIYAPKSHLHSEYSLVDHNHDNSYAAKSHSHSDYSLKTHDHDTTYSKISHNHDETYSKLAHNHDTSYAAKSHTHSEYSPTSHNHDTVYSKLTHNHDDTYSKVSHNHDEAYATKTHSHSEYSPTSHNHDETYSKLGHSHPECSPTSHNHDSVYVKKAGDTVTGSISRNSGGSWITGRDNATVKQTRQTTSSGSSWNPVASIKTSVGNWTIGNVGGENLTFSYDTDANYSAGTNTSLRATIPPKTGTVAFTNNFSFSGNVFKVST